MKKRRQLIASQFSRLKTAPIQQQLKVNPLGFLRPSSTPKRITKSSTYQLAYSPSKPRALISLTSSPMFTWILLLSAQLINSIWKWMAKPLPSPTIAPCRRVISRQWFPLCCRWKLATMSVSLLTEANSIKAPLSKHASSASCLMRSHLLMNDLFCVPR